MSQVPGLEPGMPPGDALAAVREMLRFAGVPAGEIAEAEASGTLPLLAVEHLIVSDSPRFDLDTAAERTGLTRDQVHHLWRSLGYPAPREGEPVFSDDDLELLAEIGRLVALDATTADLVLEASRVIGSSVARVASAQIDLISAASTPARPAPGPGQPPVGGAGTEAPEDDDAEETAARIVVRAATLLPIVPRVLATAWRRHLQVAARRRLALAGGEQVAVVGFADLVGFTAMSQQVSDEQLAAVVDQFEQLAFDVVTQAGGRVVKMIGDEVMFTVESPVAAAEIALALAEGTRRADDLTDLRVGLAQGPVLERENDLYGPVVNLASRATAIAFPGSILIDAEIRDHLASLDEYRLRAMRPRHLKDIGRVPLWVLRRAASVESRFAQRRQALRESLRVPPDDEDAAPGRHDPSR